MEAEGKRKVDNEDSVMIEKRAVKEVKVRVRSKDRHWFFRVPEEGSFGYGKKEEEGQ